MKKKRNKFKRRRIILAATEAIDCNKKLAKLQKLNLNALSNQLNINDAEVWIKRLDLAIIVAQNVESKNLTKKEKNEQIFKLSEQIDIEMKIWERAFNKSKRDPYQNEKQYKIMRESLEKVQDYKTLRNIFNSENLKKEIKEYESLKSSYEKKLAAANNNKKQIEDEIAAYQSCP